MKDFEYILKNNKTIIVYYLLLSSLLWFSIYYSKYMLSKITPISLVFLTTILNFIFLILIIIFTKKNIVNELKNINFKEFIIFIIFALLFSCSKIFSSTLLKFHDIQTIKIISFMITVFVSGLALYLLEKNRLDINRLIGFIFMAIGGYMFIF